MTHEEFEKLIEDTTDEIDRCFAGEVPLFDIPCLLREAFSPLWQQTQPRPAPPLVQEMQQPSTFEHRSPYGRPQYHGPGQGPGLSY